MKKLLFQKQVSGGSCAHGFFETDNLPGFKTEGFATREAANNFARRLVAAFNATRHVPIETLETDPLTLDGVEDTFERLKAQNAQLLEALVSLKKQCTDFIIPIFQQLPKGFAGGYDIPSQLAWESTVEKVDSAIAAATSTEKTETPC